MGFEGLATVGAPPALGAPEERDAGLGLVPEAKVVDGTPARHACPAARFAEASHELSVRHVGCVFCHECCLVWLPDANAMFPLIA